jgi:hypothetical protein
VTPYKKSLNGILLYLLLSRVASDVILFLQLSWLKISYLLLALNKPLSSILLPISERKDSLLCRRSGIIHFWVGTLFLSSGEIDKLVDLSKFQFSHQ